MTLASLGDQMVAYDDAGGEGPPVILAHGFLMDRTMFRPQVEALTPRFRVITWDSRSHGDTVDDGTPFTYWDLAADCLALTDHLGIARAVVGGMSQGGFVALRAALLAPDRIRGLLLFDSQAGTEDPEVVPLYQAMLDQWVAEGPSDQIAEVVSGLIIGEPTLSREWVPRWRARPHASMARPGQALLTRDDITGRLGEIDVPALVVHGSADVSISMDKAERLAAGLRRGGEVVVIEGGTHSANLTHPEPVNRAVLDFLDGLPA
jgi:pimeloyl-ACP methyl ester carboxylesterase